MAKLRVAMPPVNPPNEPPNPPKESNAAMGRCPGCGCEGKAVGRVTLESLLKPEHTARISDQPYHFCETNTCETVYFDGHGSAFVKGELTVRVGIKESESPRPVCYCFDHSIEEIEQQVRTTGRSTVLDDIMERMKTACWCESKSPQGRCCVGIVRGCIERAIRDHAHPPAAGTDETGCGDQSGSCC